MDKISIGMNVEIMRSDGRVHGAIITELKHSAKSISVEWFEKGETKGKEVDLNSLIQNNPLIFQSDSTTEKTVKSPSRSHRSISGLGGSMVNTGKNNIKSNEQTNTKLISTKKGNINQEDKRDKKKTSIQTKSSQQKDHKRLSNIAEKPERNPDKESTFSNGNGKEQSRSVTDQEESTKSSMPLAHIEEVDKICNGMSVNIERSDGRIHDAMVINVNRATRMVSVEWFENGETKGKDIDLKAIMRNNSALFRPHIFSLSTSSSKNSLNGPSGYQTDRMDRHSIVTAPAHQSQATPFSFEQITQKQTTANPIKMDVTYPVENDNNNHDAEESIQRKSRNVNDRRRTYNLEKAVTTRKKNVTTLPQIPDINEDLILLEDNYPIPNEIKENEPIEMIIAAQPQVTSRKSQLLSNIEELERNREQRRAQQGQARRKRELQMQIDPGNPNWEFLSMIRDYQSQLIYRPLRITDAVVDNRICVCVRKRPLSKKEIFNKEVEVVTIPSKDHVVIHQPQVKVDLTKYLVNQKFRFDYAFNENADNELVYKFSAQPLVRTIFQRGFATCFAYGQTGSGKTHTMGGIIEGKRQDCTNGVYAMTAHDVFALLHSPEYRNEGLMASCSFFEIYGTKVFDLLARKAVLRVLEDGKHLVQVIGLKEIQVQSVEDVLKQIKIGSDQRTAGQTSANSNSSRSHAVFQIILRKRDKPSNLYGKFSLIDLAGNERGADTISSDRQTRLEGAEINKSLLALKECIRAMGRDEQHIPFRGSKLTLILRDSFVGRNAKTCMIAMISPGISCVENTMNTLRYADRVKELGSDRDGEDFQPGEEEEYDDLEDLLGAGDFMGAD